MNLAEKKNADISRNKTALIGICTMNVVIAIAYLMEVIKETRTILSYLIVLALCLIPSIMSVITYLKNKDSISVRYISGIGFSLLYTYVMFTSKTDLAFCYIIVALVIWLCM